MKHGSLFSGIGGFDLAAEWMEWDNIFHCEWNDFGQRVLKNYWFKAITYEDITKTDFTIHRGQIDILTGGFPCQPYSSAGKRKGKEDDRHLWPEMLRAILEIQPRWVVGENVPGLVNWNGGMVFDEVQADLEAEGYEIIPFILPACAVNAPHRRDRVWFVAFNAKCNASGQTEDIRGKDTGRIGKNEQKGVFQQENNKRSGLGEISSDVIADTKGKQGERVRFEQSKFSQQKQGEFRRNDSEMGNGNVTNPECIGSPGEEHGKKKSGLNTEEIKGIGWKNFPTESPVHNGNDGLPTDLVRQRIREDSMGYLSEKEIDKIISKASIEWRNESIKAGGNAIVPQVVYQIFKSIEQYEKSFIEKPC